MKERDIQNWVSKTFGLAALFLLALAITEALGIANQKTRAVLMGGIFIAGTINWLVQARQKCPQCGEEYGYRIRIVNVKTCRRCGAEFPSIWNKEQE